MTTEKKISIQTWSAIAMLAVGSVLSVAGFCVPPVGEVDDSVLYLFAQCLIYAGSIFGVSSYYKAKFNELKHRVDEFTDTYRQKEGGKACA